MKQESLSCLGTKDLWKWSTFSKAQTKDKYENNLNYTKLAQKQSLNYDVKKLNLRFLADSTTFDCFCVLLV